MYEEIRRHQEHAATGFIRNGIDIDAAIEVLTFRDCDAAYAHLELAVSDPPCELRPLRLRRMLVRDQFRDGGEQPFLADEKRTDDGRRGTVQRSAHSAEVGRVNE